MSTQDLYKPDCIRTYTGKYLDVFNPDPEQIDILDIAHALANTCRFGGHTREFYSVAQHSIMVAELVPPELKLQALMHDAAEAYLTDIPTPIKKRLPGYVELEDNLMKVIAARFGFDWPMADEVKAADKAELEYEWYNYMNPPLVKSPDIVTTKFSRSIQMNFRVTYHRSKAVYLFLNYFQNTYHNSHDTGIRYIQVGR
jgi:hypothetical protein